MIDAPPCQEKDCDNRAIAKYTDQAHTTFLCVECCVRYVRAAAPRSLLLSISAFPATELETPPILQEPLPFSGEQTDTQVIEGAGIADVVPGFKKIDTVQEGGPEGDQEG
jgi:hypothetical protein